MSENELEVLERDSGFLFGRMLSLGIIIWYQTPTIERFERIAKHFPDLRQCEGGFAMLTIVRPECSPIGPDIRSAFDLSLKSNRHALLGTATIIQIEGVLGGLSRAIARTMSVISRVPYPNNVYASVADAAQWLPEILSQRQSIDLTSQEILDQVGRYLTSPNG